LARKRSKQLSYTRIFAQQKCYATVQIVANTPVKIKVLGFTTRLFAEPGGSP
jgi:hypothetical protein